MSKQTFKKYLDEQDKPKKCAKCGSKWLPDAYGKCTNCGSKKVAETVEFKAPEGEKKCKICGMGSTKCLCKKDKVTPGPLNTTTFLEPGAVMSIKGV